MTNRNRLQALVCLVLSAVVAIGQTPQTPKPAVQDQADVVRVTTELVQTDVTVFDKSGQFVRDLKRENFELKIDGKAKPIEFFETVVAGTTSEEIQLAAARGDARPNTGGADGPKPLDRGRTVFFYVDDLHLDLGGLNASKKLISQFIEKDMGQNDQAAISSATGQIGFLQQLTDNKLVLRTAVERLKNRQFIIRNMDELVMTEYQSLMIDRGDRDVLNYFVEEYMKRNPNIPRETAETEIAGRANRMLQEAATATTNTLIGLEGLVRSLRDQPGRKLIFFLSGGFFLDTRNSSSTDRLRQIVSAAARSGSVIYSLDARGLVASTDDPTQKAQIDMSGRLGRAGMGELSASQDLMNAIAKDTGGKTVFNTNALGPGLRKALTETSTYYLLAWRPEAQTGSSKFRRLEVQVTGRPDLTVQVRRGFYDIEPPPRQAKKSDESEKVAASPIEPQLGKVIAEAYPNRTIPLSLNLNYTEDAKGALLSAAMHVPSEFISFSTVEGKQVGTINLAGSFYNDRGQVGASFNKPISLTATGDVDVAMTKGIVYRYNIYLKPGLYQVRVGARDQKTGRAGSAHSWIDIPDLTGGELNLSSLLVGARDTSTGEPPTSPEMAITPINQSVVRRFSNSSYLRLLVYVYNAAVSPADSKPDLAVQVQVVREEQPVVTAPQKRIPTEGITDLKRIPYAAELSLADLAAGSYQLQVSVVDRVAKKSATKQLRFEIQ